MKTIGLIGGLGPESTAAYYKDIIAAFNTRYAGSGYPEIILYSANLYEFMVLVDQKQWREMAAWLLTKIHTVHQAGADFAAIASNTPHIVFDDIAAQSPIPLLSIVEATCAKIVDMGLTRVGLMGTQLTMESDFYQKPFISREVSVVVPSGPEQQLIHEKLFAEIELGIFKASTRQALLKIARRMVDEDHIEALILGCTELPLILTESRFGIPFLDTTAIHCDSISAYAANPLNPGR